MQARAAAGHSAIQDYSAGFRAVGSTASVDARDNTCSTGTGVLIHWLDHNKAADNYGDFYDGSWDNETSRRNENGGSLATGVTRVWTGSNDDGTGAAGDELGQATVMRAAYNHLQGATAGPLKYLASGSSINIGRLYGLSQVFVVKAGSTAPATTDISIISSPAIGDTYRLGETVEVEVTYSEAVTVRGAPLVGLSVKSATGTDDIEYEAAYVRGSGTTKLVFALTVPSGLKDDNGIELHSDPLRLNGAMIVAASDGLPAVWNLDAEKNLGGKVDSSLVLSGGICDRTLQVRDAIVAAVAAASDCSQVTTTHLAALTGLLQVEGLTSIGAGDFAGLSGVETLGVGGSGIETLPVGLFDGLDSLTFLSVVTGLTHLPKDIFRGLGKLTTLYLWRNDIGAGGLPDGIFEPLTGLTELKLSPNPGAASFRPAADAGPGGMLSAGQTVTLGGPGTGGGPWGSNVIYSWTQTDGDDNAASTVTLSAADAAKPGFTVPALSAAAGVKLRLAVTGRGGASTGGRAASLAEFTIRALAPTGLAVVSRPVEGEEIYRRDEKIEAAVTFGDRVLVDTSLGMPTLGLGVGSSNANRQASYVRGSGTNRLVFEYTVQSTDGDGNGIEFPANGLALNGGTIVSVYGVEALLAYAAHGAQAGHKVGGSREDEVLLTGGICDRTPQLRDKLVELVKANDANVTNCSDVTTTHLAALTGTLNLDGIVSLNGNRMTGLKAGDFAWLTSITIVELSNNRLRDIPTGVFDPLTSVTGLNLAANGTAADDGLTHLPAGLFDRLTGLTSLRLDDNDLSSLPPRIFEKLTNLTAAGLSLNRNPGSARFVPVAKAGPEGGIEVASGGSVTLGVEGAVNGYDDPWGTNVKYAWSRTEGTGGTLTNERTARAAFTAPATGEDVTHAFRLTATGEGARSSGSSNRHRATADIAVRVAAGPKVAGVAFASVKPGGNERLYRAGETIEVALRFDREVTVETAGGTPEVALSLDADSRAAAWRGGSGSRVLTFGYVVQQQDRALNGVGVVANSLALNGGRIAAVSDGGAAVLGHAALAVDADRTVNGGSSLLPVTGGICGRTPAVTAAIVERVRADEGDNNLHCDDINSTRLRAITGRLDVSAQVSKHGRMTALKAGDFDGLTGVTALDLDNHALRSFPAGIFGPLTALTELSIAYNQTQASDSLMTLPAGPFDSLAGTLRILRLEHNDLETLPDGIFEKLTNLTTLTLHGNPGSARFLPVAVAGPEGGIDARAGHPEKLGGDAGGPWGNNLVYSWRRAAGTTVDPSATDVPKPTLTAPVLAEATALEYELTVTARGTSLTATDRVTVRVAAAATVSSVALSSRPIADSTYKLGEKIGAAVTFSQPVTVTVTETEKATLDLTVGTNTRQAAYARGTGTNRLVFEYTVVQADADGDGISIEAGRLALAAGAAIVDADGAVALLDHGALAAQSGHKVAGSDDALTGGICGRTAQVRDKLVELVKAKPGNGTRVTDCSKVTEADLAALTGTLQLGVAGIATLKPGDFADLGGITRLKLNTNDLTALPAGVFEGLGASLTELALQFNDLQTIPAGVFNGLTGLTNLHLNSNDLSSLPPAIFEKLTNLTLLSLSGNRLSSLPPRIFEKLTGLTILSLRDNPGSADLVPVAKAEPEGGIDDVPQGGSVTLGVAGAENGFDDPWGSNVTHSWSQTAGASQGAGNWTTARPTFTAPAADGTLTFTLTVAGTGEANSSAVNSYAATATVSVRVGITPGMEPMPESAVVNGERLTLTYSEKLQEIDPAPAADKSQVYLAVVSAPGVRRNIEPVPPSAVVVMGNERQVILTLDPPVEYNQVVTLSYFPDNATAASRIRDLGGNLADGFTGLRVRNETPEGNTIKNIALTGPAKTYRIGDTVGIEVTFSEAVDVTGAPTLALEIGAGARKAAYVRGSGSDVLTFEYPVVLGEEDTNGIAVEANGLAVPPGGSILDTADGEAAILRHGRVHFPDRGVDGVRPTPTPDPAVSAGPGVSIAWTEPLDATAVPAGAGGFTVNVPGAANPAVTAVTISGSVVNLALNAPIALGTTGVTVDYTPTATPIRDAAGNAAEAFASPLAVTVAVDMTAPALTAAAVDGDTLTLTYSEPLKVTSPAAAVFEVSVTGGGTLAVSNIRAGVGPGNTRVTMTLDPPAQAGQTITASHIPGNGTTATGIQDLAGNAAIGFTATTALDPPVTLDNRTGAPTLALSKPQVTEGDDAEVTLTLSTGGTTYATDRTFTISAGADATALETEDWSLPSTSVVLRVGQDTVTATLAIVDDARLEPAETVSFKASLDGAETAAATLAIADDDRAVLAVQGPAQPVTEGGAIELRLRLEPHPDNVANAAAVPDEACILDFPVSAMLTRAGDTGAALPPGATLETDHVFAAAAFDACTREVTVSVPTRASDGVWMADRALTFALAPQQGSDPRVEAGEPLQATVRDDTPPPGPMVTSVAITPLPAEASEEHGPRYSKEAFLALPAGAVHGPGTRLSFTLTFDTAVTVTPDPQTRALPELVLDVFGRERRAQLSGNRTDTGTLTFRWTVSKGDNDPDGLKIRSIDLAGATIRFASGCQGNDPCDMDVGTFKNEHGKRHKAHRVRGGLHAMRLAVSGSAREGEPFTVRVERDGGYREPAHAIVRMTDSGMESPAPGEESAVNHGLRLMSFPFDADPERGPDSRVSVETVTPPGDGVADARTLKLELFATDVGDGGVSYWYVTGDPVEVTVAVADTGLARGTPDTPSLGVWDAWTREPTPEQWNRGTRFPLLFDVTVPWPNVLRPRGDETVTVRYATRDGTAVAGADYAATRGTLTFEAGETRKTVEVEVLADRHDEGEETMTLVLSDATGAALERAEAVGTIRNNGPIPKAWIARFGRTVAEQVLEAVEGRMRAAPAPGAEVALAGERIGGQSPDPGSEAGTGRGPGQAGSGSEAERGRRTGRGGPARRGSPGATRCGSPAG